MDPKPSKYEPKQAQDVLDLVMAHPLAWIVSADDGFGATPLPMRPRLDDEGRLVALAGHFARSNPQVERLRQLPRALILFMGPQAYVSPSWLSDRTQAATWNYASVAFECSLSFIDEAAGIREVLDDLIAVTEAGRPNAWSMDDMGARAERLARGIIAFRADILSCVPSFKMGQDENDTCYTEILRGLETAGEGEVAAEMRRQNPDRA